MTRAVGGQGREGGRMYLATGGQQQSSIVQNVKEIKGSEAEERVVSRLRLRLRLRGAHMGRNGPHSLRCCHPRIPRFAPQKWLHLNP